MTFHIRPYVDSDLKAVADVLNAAAEGDMYRSTSADALQQSFQEPGYDPRQQALVATTSDGRIVGFRIYRRRCRRHEPITIYDISGGAEPASAAADLHLLEAVSALALADAQAHGETRVWAHVRCFESDHAQQQRLEACGFHPERRLVIMERDLSEPLTPAAAPDGFEWGTATDADEWYTAYEEAFEDHWGQMIMPRALWDYITSQPAYDPTLNLLALEVGTGQIAGFCYAKLLSARKGEIRWLGVRPQWRRRGLAEALTKAGLWALQARGAQICVLGADAESATGPVRVYERSGFRIVRQQRVYRKAIG